MENSMVHCNLYTWRYLGMSIIIVTTKMLQEFPYYLNDWPNKFILYPSVWEGLCDMPLVVYWEDIVSLVNKHTNLIDWSETVIKLPQPLGRLLSISCVASLHNHGLVFMISRNPPPPTWKMILWPFLFSHSTWKIEFAGLPSFLVHVPWYNICSQLQCRSLHYSLNTSKGLRE